MHRIITAFVGTLALLTLAGCDTVPQRAAPAPPRTAQILVPALQSVEPDKQTQEKDGIRISIAAYPFSTKSLVKREFRRSPSILIINDTYPAEMRETVRQEVVPRNLRLKVKINNNLERVLRLAGTVVVFQAAGKNLPVSQTGYQEFLNGIVLPRQEVEYDITGPEVGALPSNTPVGFLLYDIVTATDPAGNATKRSNFEWFYTVAKEPKTVDASVSVRSVKLNRETAERLIQAERGQVGAWVTLPTVR